MKIAKRVVTGLIGTIALTSLILYAINVYYADRAASSLKTPADAADINSGASETGEDSQDNLSIDFSERNLVYQSQDASDGALDSDADDSDAGSHLTDTKNADRQSAADNEGSQTDTEPEDSDDTDRQSAADNENSQTDSKSEDSADSTAGSDRQDGQASADKDKNTGETKAQTSSGKTAENTAETKETAAKTDTKKTSADKSADKSKESKDKKDKDTGSKTDNTFHTVTEEYFSDALFIGDSRTVGMQQSGLLPGATFYAKTGIGIGEILSERIVNEGGYMISVKDALSRHSFGKVYIMIGINDMSMGDTEWFTEQYIQILDTVQSTQPDAVIYIQGNIPMSYSAQDLHGSLNNQNLKRRDEASQALADSKTIFYLDVNTLYADANGHLAAMYTTDGLHIKPNYYPLWTDYLKHRAIIR